MIFDEGQQAVCEQTADARAGIIAVALVGRPKTCTGWNAKIFNAAFKAARAGLDEAAEWLASQRRHAPDDLARARVAAIEVLMARLPRAKPEQLGRLRARIAAIKSGALDTAPEVQAALLVLAQKASWTPDQVRGDEVGGRSGK